MSVGQTLPKGHLPVFSVDTKSEADQLVIATCPIGYDGKHYARELANEQTFENLAKFSDKLAMVHDRYVQIGNCECSK